MFFGLFGLVKENDTYTEISISPRSLKPFDLPAILQSLGSSKITYKGLVWGAYHELNDEYYSRKLTGFIKLYNSNLANSDSPTNQLINGMRVYELYYPDTSPQNVKTTPTRGRLISEVIID